MNGKSCPQGAAPDESFRGDDHTITRRATNCRHAEVINLRTALTTAQDSHDEASQQELCGRLDELFVAGGWRHAHDRDIRRLRQLLDPRPLNTDHEVAAWAATWQHMRVQGLLTEHLREFIRDEVERLKAAS